MDKSKRSNDGFWLLNRNLANPLGPLHSLNRDSIRRSAVLYDSLGANIYADSLHSRKLRKKSEECDWQEKRWDGWMDIG